MGNKNIKPVLKSANTKAVFQEETTQWSDSQITWSDARAFWGGADRKQELGPVLHSVGFSTQLPSADSGGPMGLLLIFTHPEDVF